MKIECHNLIDRWWLRRFTHLTHCLGSIYDKEQVQSSRAVSHLVISSGDAEALNTIYHFLRQYEPGQPIPEDLRKLYLEHQLREILNRISDRINKIENWLEMVNFYCSLFIYVLMYETKLFHYQLLLNFFY